MGRSTARPARVSTVADLEGLIHLQQPSRSNLGGSQIHPSSTTVSLAYLYPLVHHKARTRGWGTADLDSLSYALRIRELTVDLHKTSPIPDHWPRSIPVAAPPKGPHYPRLEGQIGGRGQVRRVRLDWRRYDPIWQGMKMDQFLALGITCPT